SQSVKGDFDAVHLCIGHLAYKDPYGLKDHPHFIHQPFPVQEKMTEIPHDKTVGVLGTGLTAIDLFRYMQYKRPDLKVSFYSRSGTFKSVAGKHAKWKYHYFTKENIARKRAEGNGF